MASGANESKSPRLRNDLSCDFWGKKGTDFFFFSVLGHCPRQDEPCVVGIHCIYIKFQSLYNGRLIYTLA